MNQRDKTILIKIMDYCLRYETSLKTTKEGDEYYGTCRFFP